MNTPIIRENIVTVKAFVVRDGRLLLAVNFLVQHRLLRCQHYGTEPSVRSALGIRA